MKPRYRIYLSYVSSDFQSEPELRYIIQRRTWLFFWDDITHQTLSKANAQAVLEQLLREDT